MAASFNGYKYYNCQFPKCLLWSDSTPRGTTNSSRQTWIWFMALTEGFYLRPVSFLPCFNPSACVSRCCWCGSYHDVALLLHGPH